MNRILLLLLAALLLTACGDSETTTQEAAPPSRDADSVVDDWRLQRLAVDGTPIEFSTSVRDPWVGIGAEGTLTGAYPCNGFGGTVAVHDDRLVVTSLAQNLAGCEGAEGEAERAMSQLLDSHPAWELRDDILHLSGAGVDAEFTRRNTADPEEPAAGATATWTIDNTAPPSEAAESFTAMVMRLGCNGGETGVVLEPTIAAEDERIIVTFTVEAVTGGDCPGNNEVPYVVELDEPIGERELVDGACLSGDAASTSFCVDGATRWPS